MPYSEAFLSSKLDPIRISYDDLVSATNFFADDNLMNRGTYSDVYKGNLLRSEERIDVVIRRYYSSLTLRRIEFLKEIQEHSDLKHRNALSIVGFCDEYDEHMMVFDYQQNESLEKYISDPTALTWSQRLKICLGAASFLRYIHEDMKINSNHGYDHEIKSSKILLDRDWEAKVICFGFHIEYMSRYSYSKSSYTDPENNRSLGAGSQPDTGHYRISKSRSSYMSDVYSFGVILFEVLCGKKAEVKDRGAYDSFARMVKQEYEEGSLDYIINPVLRKQMHPISLSIVSQIAYDCLQQTNRRPSMNRIVEGLQQALELSLKKENLIVHSAHYIDTEKEKTKNETIG
uniref:L-type lectin-domain containing receptor kinase SIT1-like n=1 Tax=Erigeron canadensis TaxID=72917 RepID=UPI001CB9C5CA|nr:L-type lectin-domain containing receptor kinase SIT1-like [Erigeron canadensis]